MRLRYRHRRARKRTSTTDELALSVVHVSHRQPHRLPAPLGVPTPFPSTVRVTFKHKSTPANHRRRHDGVFNLHVSSVRRRARRRRRRSAPAAIRRPVVRAHRIEHDVPTPWTQQRHVWVSHEHHGRVRKVDIRVVVVFVVVVVRLDVVRRATTTTTARGAVIVDATREFTHTHNLTLHHRAPFAAYARARRRHARRRARGGQPKVGRVPAVISEPRETHRPLEARGAAANGRRRSASRAASVSRARSALDARARDDDATPAGARGLAAAGYRFEYMIMLSHYSSMCGYIHNRGVHIHGSVL